MSSDRPIVFFLSMLYCDLSSMSFLVSPNLSSFLTVIYLLNSFPVMDCSAVVALINSFVVFKNVICWNEKHNV